jgi:cell division protein ZapE
MHEVHGVLKTVKEAPDPLSLVAAHFKHNARVLCLDELFVSDIGDAMILDGLLRALFCQGITLVTTSNLPPDDLYKDGLQRQRFLPAIDLLKQHTEVMHLGGSTDHRLQFLETADIYHTPVDVRADEILCNNFLHVAPDKGTQDELLIIENRTIPTIRSAEGVVWFHFSDICDSPRSAADYIEIARCFNTVLISGVPIFHDQDDQARRFITLVDEFYDRSVNLILSAEAPPEQLYQRGRLEFEFLRTTSRLIEMQSKDYLAQAHKSI